jgi:segregation and condensation protein B
MPMEPKELRAAIEAILFVATEPVKIEELVESFTDEGKEQVEAQVEEIRKLFDEQVGGFSLEATAGGWRFATRAEQDSTLRKFYSKKGEGRLSIAALETLAIIAYRQPITGPEISDIRGVNASAVVRTLLERKMVRVAGRKNVVGSPFLYRTTRDFLIHFGLNDIRDLPKLDEFAELLGETMNDDMAPVIDEGEAEQTSIAEGVEVREEEVSAELTAEEEATFRRREEETLSNEAAARPLAHRDDQASDDEGDDAEEEPKLGDFEVAVGTPLDDDAGDAGAQGATEDVHENDEVTLESDRDEKRE